MQAVASRNDWPLRMPSRSRHSRSRSPQPPAARTPPDPSAAPNLYELERFTHADLQRWQVASERLDRLHRELYFGFESQRRGIRAQLLESLSVSPASELDISGWVRIVDYRYCLEPLSPAGSLRGIGGRFNVGDDLRSAGFDSWPALYLAENAETAYREKFQCPAGSLHKGLSPEELALQIEGGFSVAIVKGRIQSVLDTSDLRSLQPFCDLIRRFALPANVRELAAQLRIGRPYSVRTPYQLQRALHSPTWRTVPTQFDIPSNSQVFGGLTKDAGYEAILFRSSKHSGRCLALFPDRLMASDSYVELSGAYPAQVDVPRLDRASWPAFKGKLQ